VSGFAAPRPDAAPDRARLELALGHRFADGALLDTALAHASWAHETGAGPSNERLEFLGDAALDLAVARLLFDAHPGWTEGELTRARAALVNTRSLARCARALDLAPHLRLGRTERKTGGAAKESILASLFEALIGAHYCDGGLEPVERLARRLFAEALDPAAAPLAADPKTRFQEWAHARRRGTPAYVAVADTGVEEDPRRFEVEVRLADEVCGRGAGRTKRLAERAAAEAALARAALDPSCA
jgi:ribonuclease-3